MLKTQSKVKELTRECRHKDDELEDMRRKMEALKQEKRKGDKILNDVSTFMYIIHVDYKMKSLNT